MKKACIFIGVLLFIFGTLCFLEGLWWGSALFAVLGIAAIIKGCEPKIKIPSELIRIHMNYFL